MFDSKTAVERFNSLLRGEISAIETYDQAIAKAGNDAVAGSLREHRDDHVAAREAIADHIIEMGGQPDTSSGVWGSFAATVEGVAKVFGNNAAITALKQGEEHGVSAYEKALEDESLGQKCKSLISTRLLPPTRQHVRVLEGLLSV